MNSNEHVAAVVGHVGIEAKNLNNSKKFYTTLLEGLGFSVIMDTEGTRGFSNQNFQVWLSEMRDSRVDRNAPAGEEFVVADHLGYSFKTRKLSKRSR